MCSKPIRATLDSAKLLLEFYDSIPEYDDLNHLANTEFFEKIELLKQKQRTYFNNTQDDYDVIVKKSGGKSKRLNEIKDDSLNASPKSEISSIKDTITEPPPSRRSVRIKTSPSPLSTPERIKSAQTNNHSNHLENEFVGNFDDFEYSKSAPTSPIKLPKSDGITIPKPFQMTVRDEEDKIIDDLLIETKKPKKDQQLFKAHPVPIESRIPLFDKIMLDQQIQSAAVKERRKAELQAQMRPFSFTKRDEFLQDLKRELSKSSPNLCSNPDRNRARFRAKPVPKHLFSNYFYKKMYDNGFYRALQKKIRSEEMLKAATLPPSMAKREQNELRFDVCPKLFKTLTKTDNVRKKKNSSFKRMLDGCSNSNESPISDVKSNQPGGD